MKKFLFYIISLFMIQGIYSQDILLLYGGQSSQLSSAQSYASDLFDTGVFDSVDAVIWDAPNKYDISFLESYDAIMVVTNGGYNASHGMGAALTTYVDNGGGVGIFLFANASIQIGGGWNYHALVPAGQSLGPTTFGTIDIPDHPALNNPFTINTATWNVGSLWSSTSTTLAPEAYSIAKFSDGRPALQARENVGINGMGRVIDFAVFPAAASGSNKTQGYQMFANIMTWLTGAIQSTGDTCLPTNSLSFSLAEDGGSPVTSYSWDFGDGTTSTEATPTKTYTAAGEYDVTLNVVRQDTSSDVYSDKVVISGEPTIAAAGEDQYLVSGTTTAQITGNVPTIGTGVWSRISGPNTPTESITDNVLDLSGLVTGVYEYQWEISNGTCPTSNDLVQITIADNSAPSDISLSSNQLVENNAIGAVIGDFSVTDSDLGDAHILELVSGTGDEDNGSFLISDHTLQANNSFDFETDNNFSIRIRATDLFGASVEHNFLIEILNTDNEDTDEDGILDLEDNCKTTSNPDQTDTDVDGQGDACDTDDDEDGVADGLDNCVLSANGDQLDTDSDGQGDLCDTDDDNDGTPDDEDDFPLDENEDTDTDGDGTGDNADTDDDNDGTLDEADDFPLDENEDTDTDGDGTGNNADSDDDNDGTPDNEDDFPLDENEDTDTDGDGTGDNADTDDDNDGTPDNEDVFPLDENEDTDTDGDGIGDNADTDDDNDGTPDNQDDFPLDENEDTDTDGDGTGDNADTDDDNDGTLDEADDFPLDENEDTDTDGDGTGNNADTDDDDDGTPDNEDDFPLDATRDTLIDDANPNQGVSVSESSLVPAEAMTPNGDGSNDAWIIPGIENYANNSVRVFNRWGIEVFAKKGYRNDWEGNHNGNRERLPAGSYYYIIDLGDGSQPMNGWIFINY